MQVKSLGANMTQVQIAPDILLFFSYETPVAAWITGKGIYYTTKKYSNTTTKHINKFIQSLGLTGTPPQPRPQAFFDHLQIGVKKNPSTRKTNHSVGQRVEISPSYDLWMRGDRYGEIVKITKKSIHIRMDKSKRILRVPLYRPTGIYQVINPSSRRKKVARKSPRKVRKYIPLHTVLKGNPVRSAQFTGRGKRSSRKPLMATTPSYRADAQHLVSKKKHVQVQVQRGNFWRTFAMFPCTPEGEANAKQYAKMIHRKYSSYVIRVVK